MKTLNFSPFPNIITERLLLRQIKEEDEKEIFVFRSDKRIIEFIPMPKTETIEYTRIHIEKIMEGIKNNEWILWGICLKNEIKLIGTICLWNVSEDGLKAEIGYVLHPDFQKKGLMQEAVEKVIEFGFEKMNLHFIEADLSGANIRSIKLLMRNGFVCSGKRENTVVYSLEKK